MSYRVLEVNVDDIGFSGVYSLVASVIANKPADIQIDIAAFEHFENEENIEKLASYGTKVIYVGYEGSKIIKQHMIYRHLLAYLRENHYDCVHVHSDVASKLYIAGRAAKEAGVPKIIFHSHATEVDGNYKSIKRFMHKVTRPKLIKFGTDFVACSDLAARWMYPGIPEKDIKIINNGIDLGKFKYNPLVRARVREKLHFGDELVVGHVGRFSYQKNHEYIIRIFKNLLEKVPDAKLLLIGEGVDKERIEKLVKEEKLEKNVIFYGLSNHVEELLQAMDVFILPSHFEGLPIVGVEAQAAGLPAVFSDKITREAKLLPTAAFLPIDDSSIGDWVDTIISDSKVERKDTSDILKEEKFDISDTMKAFLSLYR
ncbi:MAG: glycosyltransferase family 1 protein [Lachnospiraceae bacterium]|uniref:Glycosyltransferase family 1 protein n=1 Tax=Candidatus Weimeria bifida TaxID=2599074 RepID=A0A6N7J250_9FIRM|nr:glycosyltransferase family 1 protein [Candidatus Weimeria bifida]RRF95910.1 MAG: glycosyltransferase family 1 protein [Lachnospiraceae bacterium]